VKVKREKGLERTSPRMVKGKEFDREGQKRARPSWEI